nr:MAG: nucleoprotein [Vaokses virus]
MIQGEGMKKQYEMSEEGKKATTSLVAKYNQQLAQPLTIPKKEDMQVLLQSHNLYQATLKSGYLYSTEGGPTYFKFGATNVRKDEIPTLPLNISTQKYMGIDLIHVLNCIKSGEIAKHGVTPVVTVFAKDTLYIPFYNSSVIDPLDAEMIYLSFLIPFYTDQINMDVELAKQTLWKAFIFLLININPKLRSYDWNSALCGQDTKVEFSQCDSVQLACKELQKARGWEASDQVVTLLQEHNIHLCDDLLVLAVFCMQAFARVMQGPEHYTNWSRNRMNALIKVAGATINLDTMFIPSLKSWTFCNSAFICCWDLRRQVFCCFFALADKTSKLGKLLITMLGWLRFHECSYLVNIDAYLINQYPYFLASSLLAPHLHTLERAYSILKDFGVLAPFIRFLKRESDVLEISSKALSEVITFVSTLTIFIRPEMTNYFMKKGTPFQLACQEVIESTLVMNIDFDIQKVNTDPHAMNTPLQQSQIMYIARTIRGSDPIQLTHNLREDALDEK